MLKKSSPALLILILTVFSCTQDFESETAAYFEYVKSERSLLESFIAKMPKGGDIHHHADGSISPSWLIQKALLSKLEIDTSTMHLKVPGASRDGSLPFAEYLNSGDSLMKIEKIKNAWSAANYDQYPSRDGHQWFFSTFEKFIPVIGGNESEMLSEICKESKSKNLQYLESIFWIGPIIGDVFKVSSGLSSPTIDDSINFDSWRSQLIDNGIKNLAIKNAYQLDSIHRATNTHGLELKFQTFALRKLDNQPFIFAQLLLGFETALISEQLIGVNFVAEEDDPNSLEYYDLHMSMFGYLKDQYPEVNISLHAGELSREFQTNPRAKNHIEKAINIGKAQRIGHGVGILEGEDNKSEVLDQMKKNGIAVEINLRSNEVILETSPGYHPIKTYLDAAVPVVISTDDTGVLGTDINEQYVLLVEYVPELEYQNLKQIVFNSIRYSFLPESAKNEQLEKLDASFVEFERQWNN